MRCGIRKSTVRSSDEGVYLQPGVHGARTRYAGTARRSEYVRFTVVSSLYRTYVRFGLVWSSYRLSALSHSFSYASSRISDSGLRRAQTTAHRLLLAC